VVLGVVAAVGVPVPVVIIPLASDSAALNMLLLGVRPTHTIGGNGDPSSSNIAMAEGVCVGVDDRELSWEWSVSSLLTISIAVLQSLPLSLSLSLSLSVSLLPLLVLSGQYPKGERS
jgi:hypothetical protein